MNEKIGKVNVQGELNTAEIEKAGKLAVVHANKIEVKTEVDAQLATNVLGELKSAMDRLEEERTSWVKPLKDYIKRLDDRFKEIRTPMEAASSALREGLLTYRARLEAKNTRAAEKAPPKLREAAKEAALANTPGQWNTLDTQTVVSKVWDFEIVDIGKVPAAFLEVNGPAVRAKIKEGAREVPGLRIYQKEILSVRKVETNQNK